VRPQPGGRARHGEKSRAEHAPNRIVAAAGLRALKESLGACRKTTKSAFLVQKLESGDFS
jgi:hypothetical protein